MRVFKVRIRKAIKINEYEITLFYMGESLSVIMEYRETNPRVGHAAIYASWRPGENGRIYINRNLVPFTQLLIFTFIFQYQKRQRMIIPTVSYPVIKLMPNSVVYKRGN